MTAAQRAAAARALGITVPAWRAGETAYFDLNPSGSIDTNSCVPSRCSGVEPDCLSMPVLV